MKLRALVITAAGIRRYLRWLGEPSEPPTLAPARDPPFFKSVAIRRHTARYVEVLGGDLEVVAVFDNKRIALKGL